MIMYEDQTHPLLAQVPLTVSPFVSLPTATTLPYTYRSLPTSLPPSSTGEQPTSSRPAFITSSTGHAAHPEDIITSCKALQEHIQKQQQDAEEILKKWQKEIEERELAEKRRVAPGWLDRGEKLLVPERKQDGTKVEGSILDAASPERQNGEAGVAGVLRPSESEGAQLDRAFGGMGT